MKHTLLVVDDDPDARDSLIRILHDEGLEFLTAASASGAWEKLRSCPVDAVISDQQMPGMKGTEFLSRVRKHMPETVRFMVTGQATLDTAIKAINEGAITRFFLKPCNPTDLVVSLRDALLQKDLIAEMRNLLRQTKTQDAILRQLEITHPGITRIEKNSHGAIEIGELPSSAEQLIEESRKVFDLETHSRE